MRLDRWVITVFAIAAMFERPSVGCIAPARVPAPWQQVVDDELGVDIAADDLTTQAEYLIAGATFPTKTTTVLPFDTTPYVAPHRPGDTCGYNQYYQTGIYHQPYPDALEGQAPWHAFIVIQEYPVDVRCNGAIINSKWILTSATCINKANNNINIIQAQIGLSDRAFPEPGQYYLKIADAVIYPGYVAENITNDFALIKLKRKLTFEYNWRIQPVCLPVSCSDSCVADFSTAFLSGFGPSANRYGSVNEPPEMQVNNITIYPSGFCNQTFSVENFDSTKNYGSIADAGSAATMLCAGLSWKALRKLWDKGIEDPLPNYCQEYSGAPVTCITRSGAHQLVGLAVPAYKECLNSLHEGVTSRASHGLIGKVCLQDVVDWIRNTTALSSTPEFH